jgi:hypothetical protein
MKKTNKRFTIGMLVGIFLISAVELTLTSNSTYALQSTVDLKTATPFAILAATAVTNVPTSVIVGNIGLSPAAGSNYDSGITQAQVTGTIYSTNASGPAGYVENPGLLTTAKQDLSNAYDDASGRTPATVLAGSDNQLGGKTLTPGVYSFSHATTANLTAASPLTLNGEGVYIFQAESDLVTASASSVVLTNGAQACNVFWTVPSSNGIIGSDSSFKGTVMAYSSINANSGAVIEGRLLAEIGAVTLNHNTITVPTCTAPTTETTTVTPKFPNTGSGIQISQNIIIVVSIVVAIITVALGSFLIVRKKRTL